jgi:glycolate oxidase FAD binding subunit
VRDVDLNCLNRVLEYTPEDMTVTVEAGLSLAELQAVLAGGGQWLPIDPPSPQQLTIHALLEGNVSGPRRYGYGTIRDYLIGLRVALADGRIVHSGGKVVKNVAGYDLLKLFIGGQGSLGVIVEATFKLLPLPEAEHFVQARCESWIHAGTLLESVFDSDITPVAVELHNLSAVTQLVLGFAGTREDVIWQLEEAAKLGIAEPATLGYTATFFGQDAPPLQCLSVLPSRLIATFQELGPVPFVARAGNGVIYYRGGPTPAKRLRSPSLAERVKAAFDPNRIFPELPL